MSFILEYIVSLFNYNDDDNVKNWTRRKKCVFGKRTRRLLSIFETYCDDEDRLQQHDIWAAFSHLQLYPSRSQVFEMSHSSNDEEDRATSSTTNFITFGQFCIFVSELEEHYREPPVCVRPLSFLQNRSSLNEERNKRKVFLGGSCKPTTWRQDIAIPFLKDHELTYYNPQVENWSPELIEIEDKAKQVADILFFVIDDKTRAIASLIEAGYLIGCDRQIILALKPYPKGGVSVLDEIVSPEEFLDLDRGRFILTDLVERKQIPTFNDVHAALECTDVVLKQGIKTQELSPAHKAQIVRNGHISVGRKLQKLVTAFEFFDSTNSGQLSQTDVALAVSKCTEKILPSNWSKKLSDNSTFTVEEFLSMYTEYNYQSVSIWQNICGTVISLIQSFWGKSPPPIVYGNAQNYADVFLGGSCGESDWRQNVAIPLLRKHGLSYVNPQLPQWTMHSIPVEFSLRNKCRLLLYVITGETRACAAMTEVGYYAGLGCNLVLCMQNLQNGVVINNEKLTLRGVTDYNRGRMYLSDLTRREGIPVFNDVEEAVRHAISLLTMIQSNCDIAKSD